MSRYLTIETEVIPFYLAVRGEVPKLLRMSHLLYDYYGIGAETRRQADRLVEVLNAIEDNMRNYDECCDGTLSSETHLILRLCDAINAGYAGAVSDQSSGWTYAVRMNASIQRIREAVSEVRQLARLRTCEYCNQLETECECERCDHCNMRTQDCECEHCSECGAHIDECSCDRCDYCGEIMGMCECERCNRCHERINNCECAEVVVAIDSMPF